MYKYFHKEGTLTLQHFIIFFGTFELFLSQLPNIHSLRWVNALCTLSTIGFAGTTIGVTIYNGTPGEIIWFFACLFFLSNLSYWVNCLLSNLKQAQFHGFHVLVGGKIDRNSVSYSLQGSSPLKTFKAFNALGAIAFSFGDAMLPEIQVYIFHDYLNWSLSHSIIYF